MNEFAKHLSYKNQINYGSFYTPKKYVDLVKMWMHEYAINCQYTIFDPSCGYGAFFELKEEFEDNKFIGNDIDEVAIKKAKEYFPFVKSYNKNLFINIDRATYDIKPNEKLIIVGNPPYNDVTSQAHQNLKKYIIDMDTEVKTRDYGMTSLLVYNKLEADYVIVLHPLSYLIKKANFNSCLKFFNNYKILEHIIFNSQEFANTSKTMGFPIIVSMYKRYVNNGLSYKDILNMKFRTIEGNVFSLNDRDYLSNYIKKYPNNDRYEKEILFYTLRDINALKRSRTFIKNREANAVDVNPKKLSFYCYIDCFKMFADTPYYMGNFDIPFIYNEFNSIEKDVVSISKYKHQDIFGRNVLEPSNDSIVKVKKYINKVLQY